MDNSASNLYELLENAAKDISGNAISIYNPGNTEQIGRRITYNSLLETAKSNAVLLRNNEHVAAGSPVLLHFANHTDNIEWFWAVVVAGLVPAISTPFTNDEEQRRRHLLHLKSLLNDPLVLTTESLLAEFGSVDSLNVKTIEHLRTHASKSLSIYTELSPLKDETHLVITTSEKALISSPILSDDGGINATVTVVENTPPGTPTLHSFDGATRTNNEVAVLMLTSGSTGNAKAVCLRHGQLLTALRGKSIYHGTKNNDSFLNWIGLDHVANLTEIHLHAMSLAADQVHVQPADLLMKPITFLNLINRHRTAYTFAPNFFLASLRTALEQLKPLEQKIDLSCLRALISGGEVNVVETCDSLTRLLMPHGASDAFIRPGFGMTETCAGSIYSLGCPKYDLTNSHEFTSLGNCIPGLRMRITNNGVLAASNEVGDLELQGPILFEEYYNNKQATSEAFTNDRWFVTGDRGRIDHKGQLSLVGRAKESIIINGVKYFPQSIESAIEEASIPGMAPAYTAVFPHRPEGSQTEVIVVVYLPTYHFTDIETRLSVSDAISRISALQSGVKPYCIIPLEKELLPKSSLGKLSRAKIRTAFESGVYEPYRRLNDIVIQDHRTRSRQRPANDMERTILKVFAEMFDVTEEDVGVNTSLYDMGASSIELIRYKQAVQEALDLKEDIPVITVLTKPTIRGLTEALQARTSGVQEYSPVVCLQREGKGVPLWLVHPGVGEILVFLNLAKFITDRPVYAMRARGFNEGETFFENIQEVVTTYHAAIKNTQPNGPYAIAGYSYGSMLAFEMTKLFEKNGDKVAFLGVFNLPPHIKYRMRQLDWTEVVLSLSYFLDLMTEQHAHTISPAMHALTRDQVLNHIISEAPPKRLKEMILDKEKLANWADLAAQMQSMAQDYDPSGMVTAMDVFYAVPLKVAAKNKEEWRAKHLNRWIGFVDEEPRFHDVDGAHYTMLNPENVLSFSKKLKSALKDRGL